MAWGTICGSNISLLSSARASLSTGLYSSWMTKHGGALTEIGFFEYSAATFGPMLISLGLAYVILRWFHRPEGISVDAAVKRLEERSRELGAVSRNERVTAVAIVLLVLCMVIWGKQYGIGSIALAGTALLFTARVATWEDVEGYVNWGVVLLYGGAIAVAAAIEETKAVDVLVTNYIPLHALPVWIVIGICAGLTVVITAFVSNAAAIALLLPISLTIAGELAINPRAMAILLPIAAGLDFSLPVSTPAMAMVFGTGYLRTQDSVVPGVLLSIVATSATLLFTAVFWPYLGLPLVGG
jgi:sodium-dependent dicarboxylate transporter 2/3/5